MLFLIAFMLFIVAVVLGQVFNWHFLKGLYLGIVVFCLLVFISAIIYSIYSPVYTESAQTYEIEAIDSESNMVTVDGEQYYYDVKYDKNAETPYAVIAKRETNLLDYLLTFHFTRTKTKVYIYTNNISLTD